MYISIWDKLLNPKNTKISNPFNTEATGATISSPLFDFSMNSISTNSFSYNADYSLLSNNPYYSDCSYWNTWLNPLGSSSVSTQTQSGLFNLSMPSFLQTLDFTQYKTFNVNTNSIFGGGYSSSASSLFGIDKIFSVPVINLTTNYNTQSPTTTFDRNTYPSITTNSVSRPKPITGQGYNLSLSSSNKKELAKIEGIFNKNRAKYEKVAQATGIPAELICAIHYRESGCNFGTYLHNGQKLGRRTTIVPKGLLFYDWTEAAIHAIKSQSAYKNVKPNDLSSQLEFAERYNGLGYRKRGVASPYIWSGTTKYTGGMYVADGKYSSAAKDKRVGVAAILDTLYA